MTGKDRIYSREEFAEILERAEDIERRAEVALGSQPGFSLTEMRAIAAEAGIDPDAVEKAAQLLPPATRGMPINHTTTGLLRQRIQMSFPVALTAESSAKLLAVIRASSGRSGSGEVTVTGLSWWANQGDMRVEAHAAEHSTLVEVSIGRSRLLIAPVLVGSMIAWILASLLDVANAVVFFSSIAVGIGVAGTMLGTFVRSGKRRTQKLLDSIARAMPLLARPEVDPGRSHADRDGGPNAGRE